MRAQDAPPPAATGKLAIPKPAFPTLKDALAVTSWNNAERGPLFAIAPEHVNEPRKPATPTTPAADDTEDARQPLVPPRPGFGLNASTVARHFERRLVTVGSLTALVPLEMVEFNRDLKAANPYHDLDPEDKMRRLEASLSPSQWTQLGSSAGLGMADLSKDQQPLFDALLPDTMRIVRIKMPALDTSPDASNMASTPVAILSATDRAAVHIRLDRSVSLSLIDPSGDAVPTEHSFSSDAPGTPLLELQDDPEKDNEDFDYQGRPMLLRHANTLKKSDLDLHAADMEAAISVAGLKTVGDVVKAIRTKLGREIYVDGRLARLTVYFSSQVHGVRVGDLLEALCWSLTSTFRKVGPLPNTPVGSGDTGAVYLLTNDIEGIAVRSGITWTWLREAEAEQEAVVAALKKSDASLQSDDFAHFAPTDLLALTPDAEKLLEDARQNNTLDSVTLPVSALSDEQKKQFQTLLAVYAKESQDSEEKPPRARTDKVGITPSLGLTFVIPNVGEIRQNETWNDPRLTAPEEKVKADRIAMLRKTYQSGPVAVHGAIVCLAPKSAGEVVTAMEALKPRGITALWLRVPETPEGRALLTDSIAAGQKQGVAVGALLSLMEVSPSDLTEPLPAVLEDRNLFGETGAEAHARIDAAFFAKQPPDAKQPFRNIDATSRITPEGEAALLHLKKRVNAVAALPGLSALAWDRAATNGYNWRNSPTTILWPGTDFGYSLSNRLAMIRQNNYDPIDFAGQSRRSGVDFGMMLPFFNGSYEEQQDDDDAPTPRGTPASVELPTTPPPPEPGELWHTFRVGQQTHLLNALSADLYAAHPKLALFLTPNADSDYFERRDRPTDPLWVEVNPGEKPPKPATSASPANSRMYRTIPFRTDTLQNLQLRMGESTASFTAPQLLASAITRIQRSTRPAAKAAGTNPPILDLSQMPVSDALSLLDAALLPASAGTAH